MRNIPRKPGPWDINARRPTKNYTIRRERGQRGFGLLATFIVLLYVLYFALFVGGIIVALHFILKYW